MVLGIKNIYEIEGVVDPWDSCLSFLNRSMSFFPRQMVEVIPKSMVMVVEAVFIEEISGMVITELLDGKEQITFTIKLKCIRNRAKLKVTNGTQDKVTFNGTDMVGIVDLRSLGYYKVKQGMLQQNLNKQYRFESANTVCNQFNRLINMLKKEEEENGKGKDKYPWLEDSDERKYMTDREILDKYGT